MNAVLRARLRGDEFATVADFLAWLEADPGVRAQLIDGEIRMMAGASKSHNRIANNLLFALRAGLAERGCEIFTLDVVVRRPDAESFAALPDVVVRCGPPAPDDDEHTISDPKVIFEVLSPSTERLDRIEKFQNYAAIPSLDAYVLVHQDEPRLEVWRRLGGSLRPQPALHGLEAVFALEALGAGIPLSVIYEGVFGD